MKGILFPAMGRALMTALELFEEPLEAKDDEKNEIAIPLAKAVKQHSCRERKKKG